jgi:hypothetical protein
MLKSGSTSRVCTTIRSEESACVPSKLRALACDNEDYDDDEKDERTDDDGNDGDDNGEADGDEE